VVLTTHRTRNKKSKKEARQLFFKKVACYTCLVARWRVYN